jgi:hypothetical protein
MKSDGNGKGIKAEVESGREEGKKTEWQKEKHRGEAGKAW